MNISTLATTTDKTAAIGDLIARYELSNRADGKSLKTVTWYTEILKSFCSYLERKQLPDDLSAFNIDNVREYILYLRQRPRFEGHPYTPQQEKTISARTVQCHVRALKAFSSWLYREGYTCDNVLKHLKLPKASRNLVEPLNPSEIRTIMSAIDQRAGDGARNHTLLLLALDTGLRAAEIAEATLPRLNLKDGYIKVMGKGSKERIVPIGNQVRLALLHYINHIRPQVASSTDHIFVSRSGKPITVNTIKLMFSRLAKRSGVRRLHAHLCRHTFSVNYLLNGGDAFTLQNILGHSSLDMVRNYLNFTASQITGRQHQFSPVDRLLDQTNEAMSLAQPKPHH
jgi:site-specific recombinase XerD